MFDKVKDMYRMQQQAKAIKKELKLIHIQAESHGIIVTIDGEQKVVSVEITDISVLQDAKKLGEYIKDAFNRAIEKSQKIAAEKMKSVMGDMGFPGA